MGKKQTQKAEFIALLKTLKPGDLERIFARALASRQANAGREV
jgi:hypothetical protein